MNYKLLDYEPVFNVICELADNYNIIARIGHIAPGLADMVNPITKLLNMNPEATFAHLYAEVAGLLKMMKGRELSLDNSTLVFAIRDSGSALTE